MEVARALLFEAHLSLSFWDKCIIITAYLINHLPSPVLSGKTPHEVLLKSPPDYISPICVFDCLCYAHNHTHNYYKFAPRATRCIFVGYPFGQKGYKVYDLKTHQIFISCDVKFYEIIFPFKDKPNLHSGPVVPLPTFNYEDNHIVTITSASATMSMNSTHPS